jgi:hypothetical protein
MRFAKWVFFLAGLSGTLLMIPLYFLEDRIAQDDPPAIEHVEFYYGFVGLCLAWQLLFLVIAANPVRFRPAMLPALVEKGSFVIAIAVLYARHRVSARLLGFAAMDATWLVLFVVAYLRTPREIPKETAKP